jgi:hypothetical protein
VRNRDADSKLRSFAQTTSDDAPGRLFAQQHVNGASATIGPRRVCEREHRSM